MNFSIDLPLGGAFSNNSLSTQNGSERKDIIVTGLSNIQAFHTLFEKDNHKMPKEFGKRPEFREQVALEKSNYMNICIAAPGAGLWSH
jgi:hypothetical protein